MNKSKRREREAHKSRGQAAGRRMYIHLAVLIIGFAAIIAGGFFLLHGRQTGAPSATPAAPESIAQPGAKTGFGSLQGRWQRPDGGYVIEIRAVDASGKMEAGYFNPRPINVSHAEATREGTTIKVFIELRDRNYSGATYNLIYDPESDQLRGVYFQPVLQQSFNVFFVRMK